MGVLFSLVEGRLGSLKGLLGIVLQVDMQHFSEQYSILVLDLTKSLHVLHFLFVVVLDVSGLGRRLHIDARLDASEPMDMHDVLLDSLPVANEPIGSGLVPH